MRVLTFTSAHVIESFQVDMPVFLRLIEQPTVVGQLYNGLTRLLVQAVVVQIRVRRLGGQRIIDDRSMSRRHGSHHGLECDDLGRQFVSTWVLFRSWEHKSLVTGFHCPAGTLGAIGRDAAVHQGLETFLARLHLA